MEVEQRRGKWRGPLHGIPIALKDNIDTAGIRTTVASELFKDRVPSEDAEVVRRLKKAGAIILGKTNLHEMAYGGTSAVSYFGRVHNPWALDRIPGGSSDGSACNHRSLRLHNVRPADRPPNRRCPVCRKNSAGAGRCLREPNAVAPAKAHSVMKSDETLALPPSGWRKLGDGADSKKV